MSKKNHTKMWIGMFIIFIFIAIILYFTKCDDNDDDKDKENYIVTEFTGINPSPNACSKSYRLFSSDLENSYTYPRNKCEACKGYNLIQYEFFCPHNCRKDGVAVCNQSLFM